MEKQSYFSVFVKECRVQVRIGLLDEEKRAPQALEISVEVFADIEMLKLAKNGQIVDYSQIYSFLLSWESRPHTDLLETLMQDLLDFCFGIDAVRAVKASITKPEIFDQAQQAGIEVFYKR